MLDPTAKTHICTILAALVNGGGTVRNEDQLPVSTALEALQTQAAADEDAIAALTARVEALEDLANGASQAIEAAPAPQAEPDPATAADPPADQVQTASVAAELLS